MIDFDVNFTRIARDSRVVTIVDVWHPPAAVGLTSLLMWLHTHLWLLHCRLPMVRYLRQALVSSGIVDLMLRVLLAMHHSLLSGILLALHHLLIDVLCGHLQHIHILRALDDLHERINFTFKKSSAIQKFLNLEQVEAHSSNLLHKLFFFLHEIWRYHVWVSVSIRSH